MLGQRADAVLGEFAFGQEHLAAAAQRATATHRIDVNAEGARRLQSELKVNTTCGASNISFGLPSRDGINSAFLTMAISSGLTSAITNPLHVDVVRACLGADVMMGHDPDCARWIRRFRESPPAGASPNAEAPRGRREGGLRRRQGST